MVVAGRPSFQTKTVSPRLPFQGNQSDCGYLYLYVATKPGAPESREVGAAKEGFIIKIQAAGIWAGVAASQHSLA